MMRGNDGGGSKKTKGLRLGDGARGFVLLIANDP